MVYNKIGVIADKTDAAEHLLNLLTANPKFVAMDKASSDIRPLSKLASGSEMQGASEHRNANVLNIHADPSTEAT